MTQLDILATGSAFDAIKHVDPDGSEWWSARELMPLLGYQRWESFQDAIYRASISAKNSGTDGGHFRGFPNVIEGGRWGSQTVQDYRLTRYGAYLVTLNGDPRKSEIAAAQSYFVIKAREAEIHDANKPRHEIPQSFADALQLAADQARQIEQQGQQIAELEPKAEQAEHFRKADGLAAVGSFCNDLQLWARENHGARLLHEEIRDFLGDIGLIIRSDSLRKNHPYAEAIKDGYVRPKHSTYETNTRGDVEATSARLTQKGWGYAWDRAVKRIADHGSLAPITAVAIPTQSLPSERS